MRAYKKQLQSPPQKEKNLKAANRSGSDWNYTGPVENLWPGKLTSSEKSDFNRAFKWLKGSFQPKMVIMVIFSYFPKILSSHL